MEITGLRGFAEKQLLRFAIAAGVPGSGLSVIVGANNSGKTTVLEALRAVASSALPSFTQGRRNSAAGDKVTLLVRDSNDGETRLETEVGSSESRRITGAKKADVSQILILPSRRVFDPYFGKHETNRRQFMDNIGFPAQRSASLSVFTHRLFNALKDKQRFDALLGRVIEPVPVWTIDQHDNGNYFVKITKTGITHTSEGAGEGVVSLLYLVDALYDSNPGDTIVIDEPELSLHPALQRKLAKLFVEYSSDRQIILSTHSPYFVDLTSLANGGHVMRVFQRDHKTRCALLSAQTGQALAASFRDLHNPHITGTNAREIFFVEDKIILTEGQEDVVYYGQIACDPAFRLNGDFYGWGVGGASKMRLIAQLLHELSFMKVVGILDADKSQVATELKATFPAYHFFCIPANDVRTKPKKTEVPEVRGLLDDRNEHIRAEFQEETQRLFGEANVYLGQ